MNLVVGFRCLVCVFVFEFVSGLPDPQRNSRQLAGGTAAGSLTSNFGSIINSTLGSGSVGTIIRGGVQGALGAIDKIISNNGSCEPRKPHTNCSITDDWRTLDTDGDGHVDSCDNCPHKHNVDQADKDGNRVGDACDSHIDSDKDGIPDSVDNCIGVANNGQRDTDLDEIGDECDCNADGCDADGDGILNQHDNCWLVHNPAQEDADNDGHGDICQGDLDGDCQKDEDDICPNDPNIHKVDFKNFHDVSLDKIEYGQDQAVFTVGDQGTSVTQELNSKPGLMIGENPFGDVDFGGTFSVRTTAGDNDFVGFIFGYQDAKNFYVVMWKKEDQKAFECNTTILAGAGIQLKRVNSKTGPSCELQDGLWSNTTTTDQVTVLWDGYKFGWENGTEYHWDLIHRPSTGLIRFRFYTGDSPNLGLVVDSGDIADSEINGGYIGVYSHSQAGITWKNLDYKCNNGSVPEEWEYDYFYEDYDYEHYFRDYTNWG